MVPDLGHALQRNSVPPPNMYCSTGHKVHGVEEVTLLETHHSSPLSMHILLVWTTLILKNGQSSFAEVWTEQDMHAETATQAPALLQDRERP